MQNLTSVLENSLDIPDLSRIKPMSPDDFEQYLADCENQQSGELEGYDCKLCKNKGYTVRLENHFRICTECKCMKIRGIIWDLKSVGLGEELEKCKFSSFHTDGLKWREDMLSTCLDYLKNGGESWLFLGGQSQTGKTHLCTAVCSQLINAGRQVKYLLWTELKQKLEALKFKQEYEDVLEQLKQYDVLYLDDFLKTPTEIKNGVDVPTKPPYQDAVLAYEAINARSITKKKTIISSEHHLPEIISYEAACGGRIHNATQNGRFSFNVGRSPDRRYSLSL